MPIIKSDNSGSVLYRSPTLYGSSVTGENIYINDKNDDISSLMKANGIYNRHDMEWYKKFNRFGIIDPYNAMTTTKEYIFITKPDLNIFDGYDLNSELSNQPIFYDANKRYKPVLEQLTHTTSGGPFVTILSNAVTSGLDLPGVSAETIETASNVNGTHITYRGQSTKSNIDHEFTLEFEDTKYLEVYWWFRLYDEYQNLKHLGYVTPKREYIVNKILYDQMTAYKFVVGEDGMTLLYWARITGCYPLGAPRDAFSDMTNVDGQKLSVSWKGQFVRDMDPRVLISFNRLVDSYIRKKDDLPLYDIKGKHPNGEWSSCPYIGFTENPISQKGKMMQAQLRWKV